MKFSKKFLDDLNEIGRLAFSEKNLWMGKLVPEIICDHVEERGIKHDDFRDCVVLTVREAKLLLEFAYGRCPDCNLNELDIFENIEKRIELVEKQDVNH